MKRKLVLSIVATAFAVLTAFAQKEETLVVNAGNIEHITIEGDLDVVLVAASANEQSILVDPLVSERISLKFSDNALSIAPANLSATRKSRVYLYVSNLKSLVIEDNANVKTWGVIKAPKLDIMIGGEASVHLRTTGIVKPRSIYGNELKVQYISENGVAKESVTKSR